MFEFSQLRCFVILAEELHFGRAAARLHMTQPPLSRQIQLLEHHVGAKLLERTSRRVSLTMAGRNFLQEAQALLHLAESASLAARRVAGGDAGVVSIGFTAASAYRFMPGLVANLRKRLPDVVIALKEMVTGEQVEALASGRLDIAMLRPHASAEDFESVCAVRESLVAVIPQAHPLATGRLPVLKDFNHIPFVMYSPLEARYFHDLVASTFFDAGVHPRIIQYTSQVHTILALVRAGLGVALVPEAATSLRYDGLVFRPLRANRSARRVELYIAWRRDSDNPARKSVLDACLDYCRSRRSVERVPGSGVRADR